MKNFKNGLLALALVAGISGAFVSKIHAAPKVQDQLYNWTHYDTDGITVLGTENGKSITEAQTDFGCSGNATRCAVGTAPDQDDVTLKYAQ